MTIAPRFETAFTVSIEARTGVTTGISAADRARTILVAIADDAKPGGTSCNQATFFRCVPVEVVFSLGQDKLKDLSIWARLAGLKPAGVYLRNHER